MMEPYSTNLLAYLQDYATFFSPDTLLKWHRMLVAASTAVPASVGQRPKKANEVRAQVLRMKAENPDWSYHIKVTGHVRVRTRMWGVHD